MIQSIACHSHWTLISRPLGTRRGIIQYKPSRTTQKTLISRQLPRPSCQLLKKGKRRKPHLYLLSAVGGGMVSLRWLIDSRAASYTTRVSVYKTSPEYST